ncbi:MAG TPA: YdcF family protein [Stellaceae bacterium]|nr:YdcF family protein [Stellaceae bacterium]
MARPDETAPEPRRRRLGAIFAAAVLAVLVAIPICWLGGLIWFAETIPRSVQDTATTTDAIVVLTGGSQRVQVGLQLLAEKKARKLFVSGVYPTVDVPALLHAEHQPAEAVQCCIVLGHIADNTYGNAQETATWMREEGYRSLRLVTASYHMRRALLEFSRTMPDARIIPNPVFTENVKQGRWWAWPGTFGLIVGEYDKYMYAVARPWLRLPLEPELTG